MQEVAVSSCGVQVASNSSPETKNLKPETITMQLKHRIYFQIKHYSTYFVCHYFFYYYFAKI